MERQETLKQELLALEKRYWTAIKHNDSHTASELSDDPCLVVGAQGVNEIDRKTMGQLVQGANFELTNYKLANVRMRELSDDVVALAYQVDEDLTVDGKKISLKAYDLSVWQKKDGDWVCVLHTESPAGDPLGRH